MSTIDIINRWYADLYDQEENQSDDVNLLLSVIGKAPQNVLEVCCGTGRILIPLAKANHTVTGFDMDDYMLERILPKAKGLTNINYSKADAVRDNWGNNFDTVILAGNILINIISDMDYKQAQKLFIKKANKALKLNGHLYLDFDYRLQPGKSYVNASERTIFERMDHRGNYGEFIIYDSNYDEKTQVSCFKRKIELVTKDGEKILRENVAIKHIPTILEVHEWLEEAGFKINSEYGDYNGNEISETTHKAVIWAEKIKE